MKAVVYGAPWCHACHQAAEWLRARGVEVEERSYEEAPGQVWSLPVIEIAGQVLTGFNKTKLAEILRRQK